MLNVTKFAEMINAKNLNASVACDMLVPVADHFDMSMEAVKLHFQSICGAGSSMIKDIATELEKRGF